MAYRNTMSIGSPSKKSVLEATEDAGNSCFLEFTRPEDGGDAPA
ncbi:hypothetical protein U5A82_00360 [Sphingobium sp. CR2-8]|nr:hypothetical protein [Sphingobium sp. CR2-8]MEC3908980.1 hypothetical protein [Sphingobium sp. CR2-8]